MGWHGVAWGDMGWHGVTWGGMGWHGVAWDDLSDRTYMDAGIKQNEALQ